MVKKTEEKEQNDKQKEEIGKKEGNGDQRSQDQVHQIDIEKIMTEISNKKFQDHGYIEKWKIWKSEFHGSFNDTYIMIGLNVKRTLFYALIISVVILVVLSL